MSKAVSNANRRSYLHHPSTYYHEVRSQGLSIDDILSSYLDHSHLLESDVTQAYSRETEVVDGALSPTLCPVGYDLPVPLQPSPLLSTQGDDLVASFDSPMHGPGFGSGMDHIDHLSILDTIIPLLNENPPAPVTHSSETYDISQLSQTNAIRQDYVSPVILPSTTISNVAETALPSGHLQEKNSPSGDLCGASVRRLATRSAGRLQKKRKRGQDVHELARCVFELICPFLGIPADLPSENSRRESGGLRRADVREARKGMEKQIFSQLFQNHQGKCWLGKNIQPGGSVHKDGTKPYACTTCCGARFNRKDTWRRHEESNYPQRVWRCQLGDCATKALNDQAYLQKEKFKTHLDQTHGHARVPIENIDAYCSSIRSNFPRRCIFKTCIKRFDNWQERVDHTAMHLRKNDWSYVDWRTESISANKGGLATNSSTAKCSDQYDENSTIGNSHDFDDSETSVGSNESDWSSVGMANERDDGGYGQESRGGGQASYSTGTSSKSAVAAALRTHL
ncbi:hypothetical protein MMC20_005637 [Loxospora ochrophaea]|nr:hypothetical protein [Loxospora ochrophaea]